MAAIIKGRYITGKPRLKPPANLCAKAKRLFLQTVESVDADHFSSVDLPLLCEYANACHQASIAAGELEKAGAVVAGKASPWLVVQEKSVRAMVALSARLRVTPQSRFDRLSAGANSRPQPFIGRRKPWERDDGDDDDGDELLAR